MKIEENYPLKLYNTFGIAASARYFTMLSSEIEIKEFLNDKKFKSIPKLILGGGSNLLFRKDFNGIVLKNDILGIELIHEDDEFYEVKAGAGVVWHNLVLHCIEH